MAKFRVGYKDKWRQCLLRFNSEHLGNLLTVGTGKMYGGKICLKQGEFKDGGNIVYASVSDVVKRPQMVAELLLNKLKENFNAKS